MGWRDDYKVHPAADVFPMMSDEELDTLGKDIEANGLHIPITFGYVGDNEHEPNTAPIRQASLPRTSHRRKYHTCAWRMSDPGTKRTKVMPRCDVSI
jgi:hypothetical protein